MEINEKLAMWRWPECDETGQSETIRLGNWLKVIDREGKVVYDGKQFPFSLDACFKWLVPKLEEWSVGTNEHFFDMTEEERHFNKDLAFEANVSSSEEGKWFYGESMAETPALALCRAIEQLIDKEQP